MVDIAGFGHADDGMNEQVRLYLTSRPQRQLLVCAMHRVTRLKRNNFAPAEFAEAFAQFCRVIAQMFEVVVCWRLDAE